MKVDDDGHFIYQEKNKLFICVIEKKNEFHFYFKAIRIAKFKKIG